MVDVRRLPGGEDDEVAVARDVLAREGGATFKDGIRVTDDQTTTTDEKVAA